MTVRAAIVAEARTWLGTPYHHMGHVKGAGVDCAWLLIEVYSAVGAIERFDPGYYPQDWSLHRGEERYLNFVLERATEVQEPRLGDLVVMRYGRTFSHGAICIGDGQIIHSYLHRGCEVAELAEFSGRRQQFYSVV